MSSEWPEFQLGDRCSVKSSKRIFAHEYVEHGVPFMRSKDVIDKALGVFVDYDLYISEERYLKIKKTHGSPLKGDILMSSVGNRSGQPYVVQDEGDFHFKDGNILWLSDFDNINSYYLSYWFKSDIGQDVLLSVMIGSAQKALTIDSIRKLWIRLPSIEYQNSAAKILIDLDKKIQLNRQINQTLEQMAQAIFQSWFVDFEPVKAKSAAREDWLARQAEQAQPHADASPSAAATSAAQTFAHARNQTSNQATNQAAKKASNETATDAAQSPAAQFPAVLSPAEQADLETLMNRAAMCAISGKTAADLDAMPAADYQRLYHTASLFPDELVESELGEIPKGWEIVRLDSLLELAYGKALKATDRTPGDFNVYGSGGVTGTHNEALVVGPGIIIGRKGTVGSLYWEDASFYPIDTVYYVKPSRSEDLSYLFYLLKTLGLDQMNTDAAVPGLNRNNVYRLLIANPGLMLIDEFSELVDVFRKTISSLNQQSELLIGMRNSLLPKLLSGELDISALTDLADHAAEPGATHV